MGVSSDGVELDEAVLYSTEDNSLEKEEGIEDLKELPGTLAAKVSKDESAHLQKSQSTSEEQTSQKSNFCYDF